MFNPAPAHIQALVEGSNQVQAAHPQQLADILDYLERFGHLEAPWRYWQNITLGDIANAVTSFQSYFGLKQDGVAGPMTIRAMLSTSRCGCPDIIRPHHKEFQRLQQAVNANLQAWTKRSLTYYINAWVSGLSQDVQRAVFAQAFQAWMNVCNIHIEETTAPGATPDIIIETGSGKASQFDGPGGTLAWAYMPTGDDQQLLMRFDIAETWTTDPVQRGILLLNVATHEFGHLLGLTHSTTSTALMAPYYNAQIATPQTNDDIPRIQARYGPAVALPAPTSTPTPVPTPTPLPPPVAPTPPGMPPISSTITLIGDITKLVITGSNLKQV